MCEGGVFGTELRPADGMKLKDILGEKLVIIRGYTAGILEYVALDMA